MDTSLNIQPATPEIVWAILRELAEKQAERQVETDRNFEKVWKQIRETGKQLGGMAYNQGRFAEEYFFNSFDKGKQNFFGEKFDEVKKNLKGTETDHEFEEVK